MAHTDSFAADLEIWLRRREDAPHEAVVSFRPPGSNDIKDLSADPRLVVTLDETKLLEASLDPANYGQALHELLFADMRMVLALNTARNQALGAKVPLRLRLRLDSDDPQLHSLRWETLIDPIGQPPAFLAANAGTLFSRYLTSADPTPVTVGAEGGLTALVAAAAPRDLVGLPPFDTAAVIGDLLPALGPVVPAKLPHVTPEGLAAALLAGPSIFYLVCHGKIIAGKPVVYLEHADGTAALLRAADFAQMLRNLARRPLLVVLATCRSAGSSDNPEHALVALGPRLAAAGVGAVVAMHDDISQVTVKVGMPIFFAELLKSGRVDLAMAAMRSALVGYRHDWWQPVLYLRLDDGRLFTPAQPAAAQPAPQPPARVLVDHTADDLAMLAGRSAELSQLAVGAQLHQALLLLNYSQHVIGFSQLARKEKLAAVLIYGPGEHGQRWLVNRLLRNTVKGKLRSFRFDLTQLVVTSSAAGIWRQLAAEFGLDRRSTPQQIAERICACRQTQHVLFFIDCLLDLMPPNGLAEFVRDFWQPLVQTASAAPVAQNYLLLMLIDQSGCARPQPLDFFEGYAPRPDQPFDPLRIVRLPSLVRFNEQELAAWAGQASVIEQLPDLPDRVAIPDLIARSDNGLPERAFDEICYAYEFDWLIGVKQWLTLY